MEHRKAGSDARSGMDREVAVIAQTLALQNAIDIKTLARANARRFIAEEAVAIERWAKLKASLRGFLQLTLRQDYPVRMLRNRLPTKSITSTRDAEFQTLAIEVMHAINSDDGRDAYWFQKRLVTYRVFVDMPFATADESLLSVRRTLLALSRSPRSEAQHNAEPSREGSRENQVHKEQRVMGATFDLVGPESLKRHIFQYWVYNTDTDEIAAEGSFIAKGDTLQEATRHLMDGLRTRLGSSATPSLKVHVKMIDQFTKQPATSTKTLAEQFVEAVRDEFRREAPKA